MTADADDADLAERLARLGLDETMAAGALGLTVRPRRGMTPADLETLAAEIAGAAAPDEALPRISVALPGAGEALPLPASGSGSRTDLELTGTLGAGAMGRVLLARQRSLRREVAIKTVHPGADADATSALLREGVVTGQLEHPSIIPVHALGLDLAGAPVLVMKRIEGAPWRRLLDDPEDPGWATWERSTRDRLGSHLEILKQVCNAVHFAHSRGIVHRDIKPENVMLGRFGEVYVVDWGIATRLAAAAEPAPFAGTPLYAAPEMVAGGPIDVRTDVYLLGAVLHEILTGRPRHAGATLREVLGSALASSPCAHDASVPDELARLCRRATHRDPSERPASALGLRRAIDDYLLHASSLSLSDSAGERLIELDALLTRSARTAEVEDRALHEILRVATECRFGFVEALRQWAENPAAIRGLEQCIEATVELELRRRDPQRARALLDDLSDAPATLVSRVRALEAEVERERQAHEALRRGARDMDPKVSALPRVLAFVGLALSTVAITAWLFIRGEARITYPQIIGFGALIAGGVVAGGVLGRKHFLRNAFDRRAFGLLAVATVAILVDRLVSAYLRTPIERVLLDNLLVFAAVSAAGALTLIRWLWWMVATFLACGGLMIAVPSHSAAVFSLGITLSTFIALYFLWKERA